MESLQLLTNRLVLRPIVEEDWDVYLEIVSHPSVCRFLLPHQRTEQFNEIWFQQSMLHHQQNTGLHFTFMICIEEEPQPIGVCSLTMRSRYGSLALLGWNIHPSHWGQGYATEAARSLIRYGFQQKRIRRIYGDCYEDNLASRRVMEKAGMQHRSGITTSLSLFWQYEDKRNKVRYALKRSFWTRRQTMLEE